MAEPVSCDDCTHFRRDNINPEVGLGFCTLRKVARYPLAPRYCRQHETAREDDDDAPGQG